MSRETPQTVTIDDVRAAAERISAHIHRTPILTSATADGELGASAFFKCENFQKTGAYKARGALNAVLQLDEGASSRGVLTHSSGNHGAALAWAARRAGMPCRVVMPEGSNPMKVKAVAGYGAEIIWCAPGRREEEAAAVGAATGATLIHPYDHPHVVAGQGTAALELFEEVSGLDVVVAPIGGGGLLSGTALVADATGARVVGGEPERADDAHRSLQSGVRQPAVVDSDTIADGLRGGIGVVAFDTLSRLGTEIVTVTEDEIVAAGLFYLQRMKLVVEPSGAAGLAALRRLDVSGARVGVIVSGGNTDFSWLP